MRRVLAMALVLALVALACGGTDGEPAAEGTTTTVSSTTTTTTAAGETTTTTTVAPETTTTTVATTTTTAGAGDAEFVLTQVVFGEMPYLTITNVGTGTGSLGGHWLCQRPSYFELPDVTLAPGEMVAVAAGGQAPDLIGVVATIDAGRALGVIRTEGGELALYSSGSFSDPSAILSYVEWGSGGHGRESVAVAAGIWPEGAFVETPPEVLAITVARVPPRAPEDWFAEIGG